jgi:hypothetical protein
MTSVTSVQHDRMMGRMLWLVETTNAATIDAMSLSEVINLTKEWSIMQATCNNLCARMAAIEFVSIGRDSGIGAFWGESHFETRAGKGESHLL